MQKEKGLCEAIKKVVDHFFLGSQICQNLSYEIAGGVAINRYYSEGRKDVAITLSSAVAVCDVGRINVVGTDANGVVHNAQKQRSEETIRLGELACKYSPHDVTVRAILQSHRAAMKNPSNELVHLYEVWETLSEKRFNQAGQVCKYLQINDCDEKRKLFRELCCNLPLNQGRHRGLHPGSLRDADPGELKKARSIARELIIKYLEYLDRQSS